ncbi:MULTISPECIES: helix-turn-helix domain-containing protein [Pseudonocardia]|uniref:Transcriptional activator FeaR n=2 Tax=Pseudonocardia TaxID=1847 RepID=A0A1Y2N3N8_PSEAH|nr:MULTISPECIES: helix-turn-helix domain-containing protein [Pseudonocardia]OSY41791.1 Transcriptional activator FeaR [Pseudonocardia autotrophica]TDN71157.1 AraC-like DNA-binding protein [Pseudonocardia autotrophica]BBG01826.1 transcriptional regulator [Pseudonocardia autotrophica]GEC22992.1 transcriptional regulator [Pseudonocardia saturnea]
MSVHGGLPWAIVGHRVMTTDLAAAVPAIGAEQRFVPWTAAVREGIAGFGFECERPHVFTGSVGTRSADGVDLVTLAGAGHAADRDAGEIAAADTGCYVLGLQLAGGARITQDGRTAVLGPGRYALYDASRPVRVEAGDGYRALCVRFAHDRVEPRGGESLAGITGTAFDYRPGLPATVWDTVISLNRNLPTLGAHGPLAMRGVMDLIGVLLRSAAGAEPQPRCDLLDRIKAYADARLGDPDLSPAGIAAAHYVSARHLHNLFAGTGTSAASWIRSRRVEMCRRDLADPAAAAMPAAAIGARWGFRGPSHFGQVFKRETGLTPAAYRERAAAQPAVSSSSSCS